MPEAPQRVERSRDTFKFVCAAEMKDFHCTFGRYDGITIVEAPSDQAKGKAVLRTRRRGMLRIETAKAFTEAQDTRSSRNLGKSD